jgi:hypothetical protein
MFDYQPQLGYPKDYSTVEFDDGFDLNSREKVRSFINNEALPRLCELGKIKSNNEDIQKAGGIIEGMLEDDLYEVVNRAKLLDYVVENYERACRTHDKIVRGLDDL